MNNNIFIAFDFGTTNIGVAVGQKITMTATALKIVKAKQGTPDWSQIDTIIKTWQPNALIVGVPYKLDNSRLKITKLAQNFIKYLQKRYSIPVYSADERLTTKAAREAIFEEGGYKALKKTPIDSIAAKLILQEWMNNCCY